MQILIVHMKILVEISHSNFVKTCTDLFISKYWTAAHGAFSTFFNFLNFLVVVLSVSVRISLFLYVNLAFHKRILYFNIYLNDLYCKTHVLSPMLMLLFKWNCSKKFLFWNTFPVNMSSALTALLVKLSQFPILVAANKIEMYLYT